MCRIRGTSNGWERYVLWMEISTPPVVWVTVQMHDGHDSDEIGLDPEQDPVGKRLCKSPADIPVDDRIDRRMDLDFV